MLWHYTDANGLLGLLRSRELWASSVEYMNDAEELMFGRRVIADVAKEVCRTYGRSHEKDAYNPALSDLRTWAASVSGQLEGLEPDPGEPMAAFATSFSSNGDQLSQWRGYANGSGFAVGFDFVALRELVGDRCGGVCRLHPICYGQDARDFVERFITHSWVNYWDPASIDDAKENLLMHTSRLKHGAFNEEQEHRLIVLNPNVESVKVRVRGAGLVPYLPIPLSSNAIKAVRVGPGNDQALQMNAAVIALQSTGFVGDVEVSVSEAPFRN